MASEAWRRQFGARMTAVNGLLDKATADLTLDQVNHKERDGVLSIAFSLAHVVGGQDRNVARFVDKGPMLWESGGWAARVGYADGTTLRTLLKRRLNVGVKELRKARDR